MDNYKVKMEEFKKKSNRTLTSDIKRTISYACGMNGSANFKMKLTLKELLDLKTYTNEQERFIMYICAIDNIIEIMKIKYPYINLTGINLSWTTEDIIRFVKNIHTKIPEFTIYD